MAEKTATYSKIISPEDYNRIVTFEHLYISASDRIIKNLIEKYKPEYKGTVQVIEIGCGPGRILPLMAEVSDIELTGIDHDKQFVRYAEHVIKEQKLPVHIIHSDFLAYTHPSRVDIFYSQGVHHHISKGEATTKYLQRIVDQLTFDGIYILSDEFLPEYTDEEERKIKAVIWYSHVIASAKRIGQTYLAQEEARTLLDDLYEGSSKEEIKTDYQIKLVLDSCTEIDQTARDRDISKAEQLARLFLESLSKLQNRTQSGDAAVDLSRGDYKICDSVLRKEIEEAGLEIIERRMVGPVDAIGGMAIYVLKAT